MLVHISDTSVEQLRTRVVALRPGLLYYVVTGRNAWHTTWITRYERDCMHFSLEEAMNYCESRRVQGTVFNIFQLPSLRFKAKAGNLVVSEINSDKYFGRMKLEELASVCTLLPIDTLNLENIWRLFRPTSSLWPPTYPSQDSIIANFDPSATELEAVPAELTRWQSQSVGSDYYLNWNQEPLGTKDTTILQNIVTQLHRPMVTKSAFKEAFLKAFKKSRNLP